MSLAKHLMELRETKAAVAQAIAIDAGALRRCECGDVVDNLNPTDAPFRFGNALVTRGSSIVSVFEGDRRALCDEIKQSIDQAPTSCYCERAFQKD